MIAVATDINLITTRTPQGVGLPCRTQPVQRVHVDKWINMWSVRFLCRQRKNCWPCLRPLVSLSSNSLMLISCAKGAMQPDAVCPNQGVCVLVSWPCKSGAMFKAFVWTSHLANCTIPLMVSPFLSPVSHKCCLGSRRRPSARQRLKKPRLWHSAVRTRKDPSIFECCLRNEIPKLKRMMLWLWCLKFQLILGGICGGLSTSYLWNLVSTFFLTEKPYRNMLREWCEANLIV